MNFMLDIKDYNKNKFFDKKYVSYPRKGLENLYNEIYEYLKDNKIPFRIQSNMQKNSMLNEENILN